MADGLPEHAYTTVATVLDRLVARAWCAEDGRRTIRFAAVGTQGAHTAVLMHEALADGQDPRPHLSTSPGPCHPKRRPVLRSSLDALDSGPTGAGSRPEAGGSLRPSDAGCAVGHRVSDRRRTASAAEGYGKGGSVSAKQGCGCMLARSQASSEVKRRREEVALGRLRTELPEDGHLLPRLDGLGHRAESQ